MYVENPVCGFTVSAKAGEYDDISDEEYEALLGDHNELNAIWNNAQRRTAGGDPAQRPAHDHNQRNQGIGFGTAPRAECDYGNTKISYDDRIAAGMRREIAGRINRIVPLRPLTVADYKTILMGLVLDDLLGTGTYRITIDDQSAEALAVQAVSTGPGVRWMRSQVVNALDDIMFDDPTVEEYMIKFPTEPRKQESCSFAPTL